MPKPLLSSGLLCGRDAPIRNLSCACSTDIRWEGMLRTPLFLMGRNFVITFVTHQGFLFGVRAHIHSRQHQQRVTVPADQNISRVVPSVSVHGSKLFWSAKYRCPVDCAIPIFMKLLLVRASQLMNHKGFPREDKACHGCHGCG